MSPARISKAIKQQERRIGAALFERSSRTVRLTPLGEQLRDDLMPAYQQIAVGIERAIDRTRRTAETLRVGYSTSWCGDLILRAAKVHMADRPNLAIHIQEVPLSNLIGLLRTGELDLQLTELPIDETDIITGPVCFSERRALIVPSDHPLAERDSIELEDLAGNTWITVQNLPIYFLDFHFPRRTPSGRTIGRGPAVTHWQEVFPHIVAGRGVTPASHRARHHHSHPYATIVPFRDAPPVEYGLLWRASESNVSVNNFVQTIVGLR